MKGVCGHFIVYFIARIQYTQTLLDSNKLSSTKYTMYSMCPAIIEYVVETFNG